jgi:hypothetical protein
MADDKITDANQNDPHQLRTSFLQGVLHEAHEQGYSKHAAGRLLVVALRAWERR